MKDSNIKHKAMFHTTNDPCNLPYRTTYCNDEYHIDAIAGHWKNVNCTLCLEAINPKTLRIKTLKKTKEMEEQQSLLKKKFKKDRKEKHNITKNKRRKK